MITVTQAKQVAIDRIAYEMEILQRGKSMVSAAADAQIKEAEISLGGLGALFPEDSGAINAELLKVCTAQIKAIIAQAEISKRQFDDDIAALAALSDEVLSLAPIDFGAKREDDLIEESSIKGSLRQFIINLQKARTDALNAQLLSTGRVLTRARQVVEQYEFVVVKGE